MTIIETKKPCRGAIRLVFSVHHPVGEDGDGKEFQPTHFTRVTLPVPFYLFFFVSHVN